jgi:acetyl-CoA carboxylase carboxyl transferase subunit beta
MNSIFAKRRARLLAMKAIRDNHIPGERAVTCPKCGQASERKLVTQGLSVCPKCGYHFPIGAYYRLSTVLDPGTFRELNEKYSAGDPLSFPGYREKLASAQRKTGLTEAVVTAAGEIGGRKCVVGVLDSRFFMGSMSAAVGEKITLAIEYAGKNRLPLILFAASGGARMQEGILSLMQMAKTSGALARFAEKGLLYISVLTDPTTGGVTASFASLGDIILAEPGALIGFAGPRVIQQTIGETLPDGFQRAEYLQEHGFVDAVVPRTHMRETLAQLLRLHERGGRL